MTSILFELLIMNDNVINFSMHASSLSGSWQISSIFHYLSRYSSIGYMFDGNVQLSHIDFGSDSPDSVLPGAR